MRPFELLDVLRVLAEVEQVVLRDTDVLDELPRRMWVSIGPLSAQGRRESLHSAIKAGVAFLPAQRRSQGTERYAR